MAFNIHQSVFSRDGDYMEKAALRYRQQLLQLFEQSSEGKALEEEGIQPGGWTDMVMEFGMTYPGVTPAQMLAADLMQGADQGNRSKMQRESRKRNRRKK
jgi:hypothetical protein